MEINNTNPSVSEREREMKKVMGYFFAAHDLALYLNTHPTDKRALTMHAEVAAKAKEAAAEFEKKYGPLTPNNCTSTERWCWIDSPWPWEQNN